MRIGILFGGVVLFIMGIILLFSFSIVKEYTITLYPMAGYMGFVISILGLSLIYKGLLSKQLTTGL